MVWPAGRNDFVAMGRKGTTADVELDARVLAPRGHRLSPHSHSKAKVQTLVAIRGALRTARPTYTLESFNAMGFFLHQGRARCPQRAGNETRVLFVPEPPIFLLKSLRKTPSNGTSSKHTL